MVHVILFVISVIISAKILSVINRNSFGTLGAYIKRAFVVWVIVWMILLALANEFEIIDISSGEEDTKLEEVEEIADSSDSVEYVEESEDTKEVIEIVEDSTETKISEEEYSINVAPELYSGTWWDMTSQSCNMQIDCQNDIYYTITVNWSHSISHNTYWTFSGVYDTELGGIVYTDGCCYYQEYQENRELLEMEMYSDGTGIIYVDEEGYLYWQDDVEDAGQNCVFEKEEY